jgi:hypothetical protein
MDFSIGMLIFKHFSKEGKRKPTTRRGLYTNLYKILVFKLLKYSQSCASREADEIFSKFNPFWITRLLFQFKLVERFILAGK